MTTQTQQLLKLINNVSRATGDGSFDDLVVPTEKKQSAPAKKKVKPITNNQSLFD